MPPRTPTQTPAGPSKASASKKAPAPASKQASTQKTGSQKAAKAKAPPKSAAQKPQKASPSPAAPALERPLGEVASGMLAHYDLTAVQGRAQLLADEGQCLAVAYATEGTLGQMMTSSHSRALRAGDLPVILHLTAAGTELPDAGALLCEHAEGSFNRASGRPDRQAVLLQLPGDHPLAALAPGGEGQELHFHPKPFRAKVQPSVCLMAWRVLAD